MEPTTRRFGRRQYIKLGGAAGIAGFAGCLGAEGEPDDDETGSDDDSNGGGAGGAGSVSWTVGTPGEGSTLHTIASGFSRILNENDSRVDLQVGSYGGSVEAIRLVGRGDDEIAASALPLASAAYNDEEPVPDGPVDFTGDQAVERKPIQSIMSNDFRLFWITTDDTDIETVADFPGRRIGVTPTGSDFNHLTFLTEIGMLDEVETVNNEFNDIGPALREGRIDASAFYVSGGTVAPGWATEIVGWDNVKIVPYTDEQLAMLDESPYTNIAPTMANEIFDREMPMDELPSCQVPYGFFLRPDLDEELVYEFTKAILDNAEQAREFTAALDSFDATYSAESLAPGIPVHAGAARYYEEEGLWREELEIA
ncbi:TAXI family TRAP transporter solute-binding subunit [Haloferacaceae archaeon DSL9]